MCQLSLSCITSSYYTPIQIRSLLKNAISNPYQLIHAASSCGTVPMAIEFARATAFMLIDVCAKRALSAGLGAPAVPAAGSPFWHLISLKRIERKQARASTLQRCIMEIPAQHTCSFHCQWADEHAASSWYLCKPCYDVL